MERFANRLSIKMSGVENIERQFLKAMPNVSLAPSTTVGDTSVPLDHGFLASAEVREKVTSIAEGYGPSALRKIGLWRRMNGPSCQVTGMEVGLGDFKTGLECLVLG